VVPLAGVPWHSDYTIAEGGKDTSFEPKLVVMVQLSDPADYDGGGFEVYSGTQIVRPRLEPGDMCLFPSFLLHRRRPIARGHRFILMTQAWGPRW
jgi:PKHD-type hydroxylase